MINISYKYVLAVANYRNMRKAAASLCITQPALTKYINRLEEDLGVRLFNRSTTPITLTESGRRFIEAASTISNLEDALLNDIKKTGTNFKRILYLRSYSRIFRPRYCLIYFPHLSSDIPMLNFIYRRT